MAEEEFRGVCREAIMANLNSSRPVNLEDLEGEICAMELSSETKRQILEDEKRAVRERRRSDWEVNSLRVAPFPPDILGDQTPLVASKRPPVSTQISRRSPPSASRSRRLVASGGDDVAHWDAGKSPVSLLPAPSAAYQMPVPGGDLPSVLLLDGFRIAKLNQAFHFNNQILLCGYPTYWDRDRNYFLYFHSQDQRWVISPRDSLAQAQSGVMLGCAFQYVDDVWNELTNDEWQKAPQVRVTPLVEQAPARSPAMAGAQPLPSRSRPPPERASVALPAADVMPYAAPAVAKAQKQAFAVDTVHIRGGFLNPKLNAVYHMDSSVQVGSRATYWDEQRRFFMYYQAAMKRWAISIRIHDAKTGEDMLDHARRGGLCGFAFEVDKLTNQWKEFYEGRWVTVQIDIHKLCTGKRAPPVAARTTASHDLPPETPLPMAVKPEPPLPPQPPQHPHPPQPPQPPQLSQPPNPPQPIQSTSRAPAAAAPAVAPVSAPSAPSALSTVAPSPVAPKTSSEKQMAAPLEQEAQAEDSAPKGEVAKAKEAEAKSSKEIPSEDESHEEKRKKRKKEKDAKNADEKENHKADKKAKKLEKEERARRKENKMREKIRQEMLAARANKPSNTKGPGTLKASPKKASRKVRDSLKSKEERKEAKRREKSERSSAPSPSEPASPGGPSRRRRWHAAIAKPWPSLWSEDDAATAVTSQPPEGATVPQPSQA